MRGNNGNNFILNMPVPSRWAVRFRKINIVALEATIPKQSRNMVKLRIFSKVCAKNKMMIQMPAKTVREATSTSLLADFLANTPGNTPSSLIANITRGLLINKAFTYANTPKNKKNEKANFEQTFTRFSDFDATRSIQAVEGALIEEIGNQIADDIFNKAFVNW